MMRVTARRLSGRRSRCATKRSVYFLAVLFLCSLCSALFQLHNLYEANLSSCIPYSYPADMWSLGVLVLAMFSYFPNETSHKLRKDFAISMHEEKMPFVWLIVDSLVGDLGVGWCDG